ncbi:MAG: murein biosynthesis integral membrane protein MurJ [Fibrobacterota bacterium]
MLARTFASAGALQFLISLVNFCLGIALANFFGASPMMDAYMAVSAFMLSFQSIFVKAQQKTLIPLLSTHSEPSSESRITAVILKANLVVFTAISVVVLLLSRPLAFIVAPGLSEAQHELMTLLFRIFAFFLLMFNLNAVLRSIYNHLHRFALPIGAQLIGAFSVLLSILVFHTQLGLFSIVAGRWMSVVLMAFILIIPIRKRLHLRFFSLRANKKILVHYGRSMLPVFSASVFMWLIRFSDSFVASFLKDGSISYLNYAMKLIKQPEMLLSVFPMIYFPMLSKLNTAEDNPQYENTFIDGFQMVLSLSLPIAVFTVLHAQPIVQLLFERGSFTHPDTIRVAGVMRFYMVMMICAPLGTFFNNVYYSRQQSGRAAFYSVLCSVINISFNVVFAWLFGVVGLAAATSLAYFTGNVLQGSNLHRAVPGFRRSRIILVAFQLIAIVVAPALFSGLLAQAYLPGQEAYWGDLTVYLLWQGAMFFGIYFLICYFAGIKNLTLVVNRFVKKMK